MEIEGDRDSWRNRESDRQRDIETEREADIQKSLEPPSIAYIFLEIMQHIKCKITARGQNHAHTKDVFYPFPYSL